MLLPFLLLSPSVSADSTQNVGQEAGLETVYTDADLISTWAYKAIQEATDKAIVEGSGGKINPKGTITRAEFTKLMVAMLEIDTEIVSVLPFEDVSETDWFYPYVQAGYYKQMISGYTDTQFLPNGPISRQEMAVMMVRALELQEQQVGAERGDLVEVSAWARTSVNTVIASGLMQGDAQSFRPHDHATREMAFTVVMRAYHYVDTEELDEEEAKEKPVAEQDRLEEIERLIRENAGFMQQMVPNPTLGSLAGEWTILGLARSGEKVPDHYYKTYYQNIVEEVQKLMPATASKAEGRLDRSKGTEHSRLILGLTSIGHDIENVGGYDLRLALADMNYVSIQGINGPIFALIAFDSLGYDIPLDENAKSQTTREELIDFILDREIKGGGWALGVNPDEPDPDITAMAIQGLTPYYEKRADVQKAVDRGLDWLSAVQDNSGGYRSWGALNAESVAQVIVALSGLGIDADKDPRFVKRGQSAIDALLSFASVEGGFYHILAGEAGNGGAAPGEVDAMATDQAMYALVAYQRFLEGHNTLYDMTDQTSSSLLKGR
ncbi:S-layer homology domain-containing protein [Bacillus horti]